jgi:diaminopimelate decarboxylase
MPRIAVGATVAGHDAAALLEAHGSPLFVYDLAVIRRRVGLLSLALPDRTEVAFAVKSNPSAAVLETLRTAGLGADVASGGELAAVLRAGFDPGAVCFTGPGKTDREIELALRIGIRALTIESLDELDSLLRMKTAAGRRQGLILRLAVEAGAEERPIIGAAGSAKFGLTDAEADEALTRLGNGTGPARAFDVLGFHAFGASNVMDAAILVAGLRELAGRAEALASDHGLAVGILDIGGGLGIPYRDDASELDIAALGEGIASEQATWIERPTLRQTRVLLEPGRWLVGPAGAYLTQVVRTKVRGGRAIAVMDGGIHHLARPMLVGEQQRVVAVGAVTGSDRSADAHVGAAAARDRSVDADGHGAAAQDRVAATHETVTATRDRAAPSYETVTATRDRATTSDALPVDVVGPLCTGLDVLATGIEAPPPRAGDIYAVLDAGAYGFSESMPFFLSHPIPAEIALDGASVRVSRGRVEPA